jgi:uncharacterized membrane protein HdeD (DUF308 family)
MAKKEKEYRKLPGTKKGFIMGRYTLWQGVDHLLHVYSRVGVEDYKRFYFNDIQAIITRKTIAGKIQNGVLGFLLLLFTLPVILNEGGWSAFWAAFAGVLLILLLINLYRGPTCETKLLTAVQTEKLYSLHRLKTAFKAMDRLRSHIESAQGRLGREDLAKIPARRVNHNAAKSLSPQVGKTATTARHEKGRSHLVLFGLLVLDGVLATSGFLFTHVIVTILSSVAGICMGIFVIIALVKQHNSNMSNALRAITWTCLGFVGITFMAGYAISMVFAFKNPGILYNQWELFKSMSSLSPWENPLVLGFDIFTMCGAFFLGIPGLLMLKRSGSRVREHTAPPALSPYRPLVASKPVVEAEGKMS